MSGRVGIGENLADGKGTDEVTAELGIRGVHREIGDGSLEGVGRGLAFRNAVNRSIALVPAAAEDEDDGEDEDEEGWLSRERRDAAKDRSRDEPSTTWGDAGRRNRRPSIDPEGWSPSSL